MTDDIKAIRDALARIGEPFSWLHRAKSNTLHKPPPAGTPYVYGDTVTTLGNDDLDYDGPVIDFVTACHPERIARLLDALEQAQRREEVLRFERDIARARAERTAKLLGGVHALAYPPRVQTEGGRAFEFRPPDPYKFMQELSDRIRAIPDELAAIDAAMSDAPGA